ncbi:unnamed protein product [Adineta steineri]|uniref:Uncharacterized protein n=1 Tax=Adineta steineri TaxID=433720 RepID=A0A814MQ95_9BILA|nr:unnamed protein product [Adineta steineri]
MSKYCQVLFSRIDNNQSDSTSIISSTENYESSPISFVPTQSASFLPISPLSKTESIASLESSSKSAFPIGRLTSQIDHTEPRHIPNKAIKQIYGRYEQTSYNDQAEFFHDEFGGVMVCVLWKPSKNTTNGHNNNVDYVKIIDQWKLLGTGIIKEMRTFPERWC